MLDCLAVQEDGNTSRRKPVFYASHY